MSFDVQAALLVFYAIFWGVILPTMSKFSPFGIDGFTKGAGKKNLFRLLWAFGILNIGPALLLIFLLHCVVPAGIPATSAAIFGAALASLSVFSFLNFGYARFGSKPWGEALYTQQELENIKDEKKVFFEMTPSKYFLYFGLFYLLVFPFIASLIERWVQF